VSLHLDGNDFSALDEGQRVALLECLIAGMIADNRVTPPEIRRFDEIVLDLPWGVSKDVLVAMIKGARDRLVAVKAPDVPEYVKKIADKFPAAELRDKIVFTMATLMLSDGELANPEKNVLGLFVISFGITAERAAAIREALHLPPQPVPVVPAPSSDDVN
jgi:uncharacterized tellurite resistance protein B-like protein